MTLIDVNRGDSPLVLGFPHTGTDIPADCRAHLNDTGRAISDTDWHVDRLYAGLISNVTSVRTTVHRYVIDVNRDPSGASLYPGQNTTGLCPLTDFDGLSIYQEGHQPDADEVDRRCTTFHVPYHAALAAELDRVRGLHGFAVLLDCHSIRSRIPFLFDATLPDFNIGTNSGRTCATDIESKVAHLCETAAGFTTVLNGRFKGGWTTRHYGQPAQNVHAIQMELAQSTYMSETPPWAFDTARAVRLRPHLAAILETLSDWSPK